MRLTVHTDYALRVLIYLAVRPAGRATIAEIAARYRISRNHLMKVVRELGRTGYVETTRGQHGGLRLARAPDAIVIGEVVRRTEPDFALAPCLETVGGSCVLTPACRLRRALQTATEAFLAALDDYSLADLVQNDAALSALLAQAVPAP
jgi:Rrf2 family nitric oxide-sensitive transcriptional repressor